MRERLKRSLNGNPCIQVWLPGRRKFDWFALPRPQNCAHALGNHQRAHDAEEEHVGNTDGDIELADRAQRREQPDTEGSADNSACEQHGGQGEIDRSAPPIADRAGHRGGGDVAGDGRHCDRRRDAEEDQERRHQETAADAEHAGDESDGEPHRENDEYVDRQVCDRKIDLQARGPRLEANGRRTGATGAAKSRVSLDQIRGAAPTNGRPTKSPQETPGSHLRLSWREGVAGRTPREWSGLSQED